MSLLYESQNLCRKELMSVCSVENKAEQEKCEFYERASYENRCMYFIFGEYCDCLKAQEDAKQRTI